MHMTLTPMDCKCWRRTVPRRPALPVMATTDLDVNIRPTFQREKEQRSPHARATVFVLRVWFLGQGVCLGVRAFEIVTVVTES